MRTAFTVSTLCYGDQTETHDIRVAAAAKSWSNEGWRIVSAESSVSSYVPRDNVRSFDGAYFVTTVVVEKIS